MSWERKTLDKLGTISRGKSKHRPRNDATLFNGDYPFIQTADVKEANFYITKYSQTYNEKGLAQSKLWPKGTLCITIAANIAETGILGIEACFPDSIMGFLPYNGVSDVRFVKYCFDILQNEFRQISQGTAQDNLSWEKLSTIMFPAPDYKEQKKIADILSAYDDLIENNQKQIQLLEEAAQRLYKEWFVDLRFPGHETTRIVDGVPEGWEVCTIDDICSLRKTALKAQNIPPGIPYIGLEHIPRKDFCLSSWGNSSAVSSTKYQYKENDILFGKIRPYFHKVGFCINSGVTSTDTIVMTAKNDSLWPILLLSVFSKDFVNYSYQNCKEGSKMPRADWNIMKNYKILNPEKTILEKFNNNIFRMTKKIKILAHQNNIISETRNMLLPKLMKEI